MQIVHQRGVKPFSLVKQRLGVRRAADAKTGVLKFPRVVSTVVRQLTKRVPEVARSALRKSRCASRLMTATRSFGNASRIPRPGPGGLVSAAQHQRTHASLLTGDHGIAQCLLALFQLVILNVNRPHVHQPFVAGMRCHVRQRLTQHVGSLRRTLPALITPYSFITGKAYQRNRG